MPNNRRREKKVKSHHATVQLQLNDNGAIGNIVLDHGENANQAVSAYHSAGASIPISQLVAGAIIHVTINEEGGGSITGEIIQGPGTMQE